MGSERQTPFSSKIPVIDFSAWTSSRSSKDSRLVVAKDLIHAFQTVGFVYLTNHGLPQDLIDQAFLTAQNLFALPLDRKSLAPHPPDPNHHRGYSRPGLEKVSQYMDGDTRVEEALREVVDCKESYEVGSEENTMQPNIWLPEEILPGFKAFTTEFYWSCHAVAEEILRCIAVGLRLEDEETLVRFHSGYNNQLRLLHYPEVAAEEMEAGRVARIGAHSDWGCITMLFQDDCGGLEVEDPSAEGSFVPATPVEGACVVNVGDLLMRWSNDTLKSTLHRVTMPPLSDRFVDDGSGRRMTRERYSIPYFVSADPESVVECLPACQSEEKPAKYSPITQDDYRKMRAKGQYRKEVAATG